ncbi:hypothetical protein [Nocardia sp. NPDC058633]|uniref:hypothetical protein n=1 Tax=Nocardia sp. NPDC058633 TaxID=3346568 RepID=UPI0036632454
MAESADDSGFTIRLDPTEAPARRIPVRYWPSPNAVIFGHLTLGESTAEGDVTRYAATFTAGPLHGEQPVYDLHITPKEPTVPKRLPDEQLRRLTQYVHPDETTEYVREWLHSMADELLELRQEQAKVRAALAGHPRCDVIPDDDLVSCGWKHAVVDIQRAIDAPHTTQRESDRG